MPRLLTRLGIILIKLSVLPKPLIIIAGIEEAVPRLLRPFRAGYLAGPLFLIVLYYLLRP